jgi:hypothetical protein
MLLDWRTIFSLRDLPTGWCLFIPKADDFEYGRINTEVMYDNFMNNFSWGG